MGKRVKPGNDNNQCQHTDAEGCRCDRKACNGINRGKQTFIFCEKHIDTAREAASEFCQD